LITLPTTGHNLDRGGLTESYCELFELVGLLLWDRLTKRHERSKDIAGLR
jgi:hypothetical protein